MFRGANLLNIDAKGRMAMPTKHREVLLVQSSGDLVITAHPHGCLLIYPQMAWEPIQSKIMALSSFDKKSEGVYQLNGELTIRDVTRPISLDVEYTGTVVDPYGQTKAGFEMNGKISRSEFGLTWSAVTEAGGVVLGDDVKLIFSIQMVAA